MWTTYNDQTGETEVRCEDESGAQLVLFADEDPAVAWAWLLENR